MAENDEAKDMLPEYDFSDGVRGKYARRFAEGTNLVRLDHDVAAVFRNSEAVNGALRAEIARRQTEGSSAG